MKKILLPKANGEKTYYKANLHCHSTFSDGTKTPQEIKDFYMAHGYSVIAYTDHNVYICHDELTDENFVAMHGVEIDAFDEHEPVACCHKHTAHICLVSMDKNNKNAPCWNRHRYLFGNNWNCLDMVQFDPDKPDFKRSYTVGCVNSIIKEGTDNGFFVTYNHPQWSVEGYEQYMQYNGMNAMEITNYGCVLDGYDEYNGHCYDDMLRGGKRLYCIATDDNHNAYADNDVRSDSFGGYVMIAAEKLTYDNIAAALEKGDFYSVSASNTQCGPEIKSLVFEDGKIKIETSAAKRIFIMTDCRANKMVSAQKDGFIYEAKFEPSDKIKWFRIEVADERGFKAYTNAYFTDELNS